MRTKIVSILILSMLACSGVLVSATSSTPVVQLPPPTEYITMTVRYGTVSWFNMTLTNISEGYDIQNGQYLGWCAQQNTHMTRDVDHAVALFSSYDPNMPVNYTNGNWNKINYVLNHKQGSRESIQNVIWYYVGENANLSSDDAQAMITDANASGSGFVPQPGQTIAIIVDVVDGVYAIQRAFLELTLPVVPSSTSPPPPSTHVNHAPTADGTAGEPYHGFAGAEIMFNGSRSYDRDGYIVSYVWDFGDGNTSSGAVVSHMYTAEGQYSVHLTVTDDKGSSNLYSTKAVITLWNYPPTNPLVYGSFNGQKNTMYEYTAVSTDQDHDNISYNFSWGDGNTTTSEVVPSGTVIVQPHYWSTAGVYALSVKTYDNKTESGATERIICIDAVLVGDLGYLLDNNGDGVYDMFYSNSTGMQTSAGQQSDGTYLLDVNGDGTWDYLFNPAAGSTEPYHAAFWGSPLSVFVIILLVGVIVIILVCSLVVVKKRKMRRGGSNGGI